jgi:prepilin-type N-terminal cleavage/methylation domain-containing protein
MNRNRSRAQRRAFTLIELLVVIAIIAILAAILFPVFAQAKLAAKKTQALSNAKQVATANLIYMTDYDDKLIKEWFGFPTAPACDWGGGVPWGTPGAFYSWRFALTPYHKSKNLLQDSTNPFADERFWTLAWDGQGNANNQYLPSNFAVNNSLIGFANGPCGGPYTPSGQDTLDVLEDVAGTIIMVPNRSQWNDLKWHFGAYGFPGGVADANDTGWCIVPRGSSTATCPARGNGPIHAVGKVSTFVWADGHAKAKAYAATLRGSDATNDDWASKLSNNPSNGLAWTQADRQLALQNLFPEYR